jgi:hypothetical protein
MEINGYQMDGYWYPANSLSLADFVSTVEQMPADVVSQYLPATTGLVEVLENTSRNFHTQHQLRDMSTTVTFDNCDNSVCVTARAALAKVQS